MFYKAVEKNNFNTGVICKGLNYMINKNMARTLLLSLHSTEILYHKTCVFYGKNKLPLEEI